MKASEASRSIVILGASGSGKSSIIEAARDPQFEEELVIPRRVITLPVREDSNSIENENVSSETFQTKLREQAIKAWWTRQLGKNSLHYYGFEVTDPQDQRTVLYSANNSMALSQTGNGVRDLLAQSDIVLIMAGREERERRLAARAPSMSAEEKEVRLRDELDFLFVGGSGEVCVIDSEAASLDECRQRFLGFVVGEGVTELSIATQEKNYAQAA